MRRAVVLVAVCALALPLALEREGGGRGAAPARFRTVIDSAAWWPDQSFWDRIGGPTYKYRRSVVFPRMRPPGRPVDIDFHEAPLRDVLIALSRATDVPIVLDPAMPMQLAFAPVSLAGDGVGFADALDLVLMQVSAEGAIVYDLDGAGIRVRPR